MLKVGGQQRGQGQLREPLEAREAQVRVEEHHGRDHHGGEQGQRGRGRDSQRGRVILARGGTWKYGVKYKLRHKYTECPKMNYVPIFL